MILGSEINGCVIVVHLLACILVRRIAKRMGVCFRCLRRDIVFPSLDDFVSFLHSQPLLVFAIQYHNSLAIHISLPEILLVEGRTLVALKVLDTTATATTTTTVVPSLWPGAEFASLEHRAES